MKDELKEGTKYDNGKPRFDLIPAYSLFELSKVYTYGVKKYDDHNWRKGIKYSRIFSAIMRHLWKWLLGSVYDGESGCLHLAHAVWGCFALMEYSIRPSIQKQYDDRYVFHVNILEDMIREGNKDTKEPPKNDK